MITLILLGYILHTLNAPTIIWVTYGFAWLWWVIRGLAEVINAATK